MQCHGCGSQVVVGEKVFRDAVCNSCGRPLRCCKNCKFYERLASNQCREPQAEWVGDKETANYCDYFRPAVNKGAGSGANASTEARKKLDGLFRKKE